MILPVICRWTVEPSGAVSDQHGMLCRSRLLVSTEAVTDTPHECEKLHDALLTGKLST